MVNDLKKFDPHAFTAQRVYDRLVEPLEDLNSSQQVNTIAVGVGNLRRTLDEIVEKFKGKAVEQQKFVVGDKDKIVQTVYVGLEQARRTNNFEQYDAVGTDVIRAINVAKASVTDLRLLERGDFDGYVKSQKLLTEGGSKWILKTLKIN